MKEKDELDEVLVNSSIGQFDDFLESSIWADMKRELGVWLEGVRNISEDPETEDKERLISIGRIDACKRFIALPEIMREGLIADLEPIPEDEKPNEMEDLIDG